MKRVIPLKERLAAFALCLVAAACGEANDDSDVIVVDPPDSTTLAVFGSATSTSTTTLRADGSPEPAPVRRAPRPHSVDRTQP